MAGIYIHIPFCRSKCGYCNFFSVASVALKQPLLKAIHREIDLTKQYLNNEPVDSVYFGGGTPSILKPEELEAMLHNIMDVYTLSHGCEITLEANPDDISPDNLSAWIAMGIRRISLGVQSFLESDLKYLDRKHDAATAKKALGLLAKSGLNSFSIDLIYAIPGQTTTMVENNLQTAIDAGTPHLSCYSLTIEPRTPLNTRIEKGIQVAPDEELFLGHWNINEQFLAKHGYMHYETSNFCLEGHLALHNANYWRDIPYLGIGPSAHSYDGISRRWNYASIQKYIDGMNNGTTIFDQEILTLQNQCNEFIMTSLRTMWGLNVEIFKARFGMEYYGHFSNAAKLLLREGFLVQQNHTLHIADQCKPTTDDILARLFLDF